MNEQALPQPLAGDILPRRTRYRTWPASLAILGAICLYLGVLMGWDERAPAGELVVPGQALPVGQGVSYVPAAGWAIDAARVMPGKAHGVRHDAMALVVSANEWTGSAREPVERTKRLALLGKEPMHFGAESPFTTPGGLAGTTMDLFGQSMHGRYWVVVDAPRKLSLVVHAQGTPDQFHRHEPALQAMVESIRLGDAP
jgi:hypothetical protein